MHDPPRGISVECNSLDCPDDVAERFDFAVAGSRRLEGGRVDKLIDELARGRTKDKLLRKE